MSKSSSKNILITGAHGFIGQALVKSLLTTNHQLFLVSRNKSYSCPGAKIFFGDLNQPKFCQKVLQGIDIVYYLAGYKKNIAFHAKQPFDFLSGNAKPLLNFLEAVQNSQVKTLVYLSSTIVDYVNVGDNVLDGYALGKYANELALQLFAKQSKISVKIVRSAAVYGPGDDFKAQTANFIPAIIDRIAKSNKDFTIWGSGKRRIQFIFVDDLVKNLLSASSNKKKNFFVVGNPEAVTVNEVVGKVIKLFGKKLVIDHDLSRPDKITKLVSFSNVVKPKINLDKGLKRTINYYQKNNV
ncbi:NAD(P)-dependent oxidoreductase [Patescibacteria group bacterium]|nr:NAD(P)-dependent oxidoreductase [Patescibacteria group bacterium]